MTPTRTITPDEVRRIADLARLTLADEDVQRLADELGRILEYVSRLEELELDADAASGAECEPAAAAPAGSTLREDEPRPSLPREAVERAAPRMEQGFFIVPKVVGP